MKYKLLATLGISLVLLVILAACGDSATPTSIPVPPTPTPPPTPKITLPPISSGFTVGATVAGTWVTTAPASAGGAIATTAPANPNQTPTPGQATLSVTAATITKASGEIVNMKFELARTPQEQETGLMGRTSLPDDTGMLFIFSSPVQVGFWMKDTLLPLSIAWIDQNGKILEIQDMEAQSLTTHTPAKPYLWALEVPKGYFDKKGIKAGDTVKLASP